MNDIDMNEWQSIRTGDVPIILLLSRSCVCFSTIFLWWPTGKQINKQAVRIDKWIERQIYRQVMHSWRVVNLPLFYQDHLLVNEQISIQSLAVSLSINGFLFEGEQITWKNVKIKVNELEGPPEDNDLCQGEHIVLLPSWRWLHSSCRQTQTDKRTKVFYSGAHVSHLWRISLVPLDASCTVITALGLTLNQNSVNIHDSMSKHKVLITPTWGWPLSICKSFKWKNFPHRGIRTCAMFWLTDRVILFGEALSPLRLSLSPSTTSPLSQSALHYLHVYD